MIILLTGSSASGKTTIGSNLADLFNFYQIDGDQVIKDLGLKSKSWNLIHGEIIKKSLEKYPQQNVIISHVVLPDKFSLYERIFKKKKIDFKIIVLKPTENILLNRSKARTCHPKPTPPKIINFFHQKFDINDFIALDCHIINNSNQTSSETIQEIVKICEINEHN